MKKYRDLKIFCLGFFSFMLINFVYENAVTEVNANRITFKEMTVKIEADMDLDISCTGKDNPNSAAENRGKGSTIESKCKGTGKIKTQIPVQRFVDNDKKN